MTFVVTAGKKFVWGQATTVAAADTIASGLSVVEACGATLNDDPVAGCQSVTCAQSATAGSIVVKTWKATATADTAVIAATTFTKKVTWWAIGT